MNWVFTQWRLFLARAKSGLKQLFRFRKLALRHVGQGIVHPRAPIGRTLFDHIPPERCVRAPHLVALKRGGLPGGVWPYGTIEAETIVSVGGSADDHAL